MLSSPYSLTLSGGVQAQVLGLAHALRRHGVDARVIGAVRRPAAGAGDHDGRAEHARA